MLNEEQANKAGLLHKIQFATETVDVSKFYEAIILYSMEYKCEVPIFIFIKKGCDEYVRL